ncbi:Thioredoxin domain-containing protein 2 [Bienertia sinuspersici]
MIQKKVPEEFSVSSAKDDELVVQDGDATGSILESVQHNETNLEENDELVVRDSDATGNVAESVQQKETNFEENNELVVQDGDATGTIPELVQQNETNLEENVYVGLYGNSSEHTPKDGKNVTEDFGTSKMQPVSFHKDKEIPDSKNDDSFAAESEDSRKGKAESSETIDTYNDLPVTNCDIIVSRTLQQQRNKYLDELSNEERA